MKKHFPKWLPWMFLLALLCVGASVNSIFRFAEWRLSSPSAGQVVAFHDANTLTNIAAAAGGGTNYPPVLRIGTNVTVGSGVRQSLTLQTNASFQLVFTGTPLNGEHVCIGVSNTAAAVIYMTNSAYDPSVASNVTTFAIAGASARFFEFVCHTNFNLGAARWEVRDMLGKEVELATAGTLVLLTNIDKSIITISNISGGTQMVAAAIGTVTVTNGLSVGLNGATITNILSGSATLDFPITGLGAVSDMPITVTGAASGDVVEVGVPQGSATGVVGGYSGFASNNTVYVRFISTLAGADPASGTFRVLVFKF